MKRLSLNYSRLLIFLIFIWAAFMSWYLIYNTYDLNNSSYIDTSTFLQSLLSVLLHKAFVNTVPGGSYFSVHASPFLIFLIPFITLYKSSATLYLIQSIIIYSAAFPLFLIARIKLEDDRVAFLIAVTYLFFPYTVDFPFEVVTIFMGLMIYSYYFFEIRNYPAFFTTFLLTLSTIEFNTIIGIFFGLYLLVIFLYQYLRGSSYHPEKRIIDSIRTLFKSITGNKYALSIYAILFVSIAFYVLDTHIISYFSHGSHSIVSNLAYSNIFSISGLLHGFSFDLNAKVDSLMSLNAPYLFLSFFSPFALMEIPWFIASGISTFSPYWTLGVYYESYIIPFVALSAIFGMHKLGQWISDQHLRKKILRKLSYVFVFVSLLLFLSVLVSPLVSSLPVPVSQNNAGVSSLASLIPSNQSVFTGVNELPIVSAHVPDAWFYGSPKNYTLFNVESGPPYSLSGYGLLGASGSYALYERNFTGNPVMNDLYVNKTPVSFAPGSSVQSSFTQFLPAGNYSVSVCGNFNPVKSSIVNTNQGNTSYVYLNDDYVYIYPFQFPNPVTLKSISLNSRMTYGVYTVQSMITSTLNPESFTNYQCFYYYQYKFHGESFTYNLNLKSNTTYYLWLWSSGYPGGLYFPTHNGTTDAMIGTIADNGPTAYGQKITTVTNITATNFGPQISFYSISNFGSEHPSNMTIETNTTSKNYDFNFELTGNYQKSFNISVSGGSMVSFNINSNEINGSLIEKIIIKSSGYSFSENYFQAHPYMVLLFIFIISLPLLIASFLSFKVKRYGIVHRINKLILASATIVYFTLFGLYYFYIYLNTLPMFILALILLISITLFIVNYDWFGKPRTGEV